MGRQLANTLTEITVYTLAALAILGVLAVADGNLRWDILPESIEPIAVALIASLAVVASTCLVTSILLHLQQIAQGIGRLADDRCHHGTEATF